MEGDEEEHEAWGSADQRGTRRGDGRGTWRAICNSSGIEETKSIISGEASR